MSFSYVWETLPELGARTADFPYITIRRKCIVLSAKLRSLLRVEQNKFRHALIQFDRINYALRICPMTEDEKAAQQKTSLSTGCIYQFDTDGTEKKDQNNLPIPKPLCVLQCQGLINKLGWLKHLASSPVARKVKWKATVERDGTSVIPFIASFGRLQRISELRLPQGAKGIYAFMGHPGKTLYIGQGVLTQRINEKMDECIGMGATHVAWAEVADDMHRRRSEAHLLLQHKQKFGELPLLNTLLPTMPEYPQDPPQQAKPS